MGLSSNKTKTVSNSTETGSTVTQGTQMPVVPDWLQGAATDYFDRISAFGDMDPNSFVAGASPLQQMAFQNAPTALGGWQGQNAAASQMANQIGQQGAFTAGPAQQAQSYTGQASTMQAPRINNSTM